MTRINYDPFDTLNALLNLHRPSQGTGFPPTNIYSTEDNLVFELALAGYSKEDLAISIADNTLTVEAKALTEEVDDSRRYYERKLARRAFNRKWSLGEMVNQESISAEMINGILTVTLSLNNPKTKLIEIK